MNSSQRGDAHYVTIARLTRKRQHTPKPPHVCRQAAQPDQGAAAIRIMHRHFWMPLKETLGKRGPTPFSNATRSSSGDDTRSDNQQSR